MAPSNSNRRASGQLTRRQFLYCSTVAAGAAALTGCATGRPGLRSANERLNIGVIGLTGKGRDDVACCALENVVALCDVDEKRSAKICAKYPKARFYRDFRRMLERERSLDAVDIATPDHWHAIMAATAMKMGKHVYCQKPLTYSIHEARVLRELARQCNVATQMGNQGSAEDGLRRAVEVVQAGVIGPVRQVYLWSDRPIWPQGMDRPAGSDPVPPGLDWDLWLGPAPARPFKQGVYHPFNWRGWQDFGCGALGDMACHTANLPFRALKFGYPTGVEAESSGLNRETYPLKSTIRFEFPSREGLPPTTLWWYDGGNPKPGKPFVHDGSNKPPKEATADAEAMMGQVPGSGCMFIGDKGRLFSPDGYGTRFFVKLNDEKELVDGRNHEAVNAVPRTLQRNAFAGGSDARHHLEWFAACKGGAPGYSNFDIAARLTEIILLGCVALRARRKLEWDGANMRAPNAPSADRFIRREYRDGWTL